MTFRPLTLALRPLLKVNRVTGSSVYSTRDRIHVQPDIARHLRRRPPSLAWAKGICRCLSFNSDEEHNTSNKIEKALRGREHWERMYDAVKLYKAIHGDTLVPATYPTNPQLGNWVDNQRQAYRMRLQACVGESKEDSCDTYISDERIEKLNSIDFIWNLYDHTWNIRYTELKEYVAEHGNSIVPWNYTNNEALGLWVRKQRRNYKVTQMGGVSRESIISKDRIQKLDDLGFIWDLHEAQWLERLQELRIYKQNHGDTLVPQGYPADPSLATWVKTQREQYSCYQRKKDIEEKYSGIETLEDKVILELERLTKRLADMTEKRIQLLEAEDFVWDVNDHIWEIRFQEISDFMLLNGHAFIKERKGDPLISWVRTQRLNYKNHLTGKPTTLTDERIKRLDSIGFAWEVTNTRFQRIPKGKRQSQLHICKIVT